MSRNSTRICIALLCLVVTHLAMPFESNAIQTTGTLPGIDSNRDRPNVIFLLVDDLGWKDVGFNGNRVYRTPNIDKLANAGIVFTRAYSCGPNCAPSRASLMCGKYTPRHGVFTVGNSDRGQSKHRRLIPLSNKTALAGSFTTLADLFKQAGYRTGFFGKWHLGSAGSDEGPLQQGFDFNVAGNHTGHPRGGYFVPYDNPQLPDGPTGEYLTDRIGDEVVSFINDGQAQPFFAMVNFYSVHTPIQAKPELAKKYRSVKGINGNYAAMVESMDQNVGKILDQLVDLEMEHNTLVIFTSDNGGLGKVTQNSPLRGSKGMLYEGGIRVPLAVRWPAVIDQPRSMSEPVTGVDFFPTFVDLLNLELTDETVDGLSLASIFRSTDQGHLKPFRGRSIFWHFPAYLQGNYPGARDAKFRTRPCGAVIRGNWKLIEYFEDQHLELFDLSNDTGEQTNLAAIEVNQKNQLLNELQAWREAVRATLPTQLNPDFIED